MIHSKIGLKKSLKLKIKIIKIKKIMNQLHQY